MHLTEAELKALQDKAHQIRRLTAEMITNGMGATSREGAREHRDSFLSLLSAALRLCVEIARSTVSLVERHS